MAFLRLSVALLTAISPAVYTHAAKGNAFSDPYNSIDTFRRKGKMFMVHLIFILKMGLSGVYCLIETQDGSVVHLILKMGLSGIYCLIETHERRRLW